MNNNRKRIIKLLEILKRQSNEDYLLSNSELLTLLENQNIHSQNRKTLYEDIKTLTEEGFEIEYDKSNKAYFLQDAPFSLAEIKTIIDSLNNLKTLNKTTLNTIKNKLYSFISIYDESFLKQLININEVKNSNSKFLIHLEYVLYSIKNKQFLTITRKYKKEEEIVPLDICIINNHYYLYYHYPNNHKIYHCRFDNITKIITNNKKDDINITTENIINNIKESTNAFYSSDSQYLEIKIVNDSEYLRSRLEDDLNVLNYTKKGFLIKTSINEAFFSKLVSYQNDIYILDETIRNKYNKYLENIIIHNK